MLLSCLNYFGLRSLPNQHNSDHKKIFSKASPGIINIFQAPIEFKYRRSVKPHVSKSSYIHPKSKQPLSQRIVNCTSHSSPTNPSGAWTNSGPFGMRAHLPHTLQNNTGHVLAGRQQRVHHRNSHLIDQPFRADLRQSNDAVIELIPKRPRLPR